MLQVFCKILAVSSKVKQTFPYDPLAHSDIYQSKCKYVSTINMQIFMETSFRVTKTQKQLKYSQLMNG